MTQQKSKSPSTPHRPSQGNRDFRNRTKRSDQSPGDKNNSDQKNSPRGAPQISTGSATAQPCILLKTGREKSLLRRHPWIFSGAIERVDGAPSSGDTLPVRDGAGNFLAWAAYNPNSQITARVWSWHEAENIDAEFFRRRIANALAARNPLPNPSPGGRRACLSSPHGRGIVGGGARLIHAESDGLPGLIVDQYGDVLVMQIGSAGAERWRDTIADILQELCNPVCIYERSDSDSRGLEGLEPRNGVLRGTLPDNVEVVENG